MLLNAQLIQHFTSFIHFRTQTDFHEYRTHELTSVRTLLTTNKPIPKLCVNQKTVYIYIENLYMYYEKLVNNCKLKIESLV